MAEEEKKSIEEWEEELLGFALTKEWGRLEQRARICIQEHPGSEVGFFFFGIANVRLGQNPEAITIFDRAIEINDENYEAYYNRGTAKTQLERYKEAITDFNRAIELNIHHYKAYNGRGIVQTKLGQYADAIADFDKAVDLNPSFDEARDNRAVAVASLRAQETEERALEAYQENIKNITATNQILELYQREIEFLVNAYMA